MKLFRIPSTLVFIVLLLATPELYAQSLQLTQIQPLNGTPGSTFTIYGSGFDEAAADNTVTFTPVDGGSDTTATVSDVTGSTKLTATVPVGLTGGNYTISVERASDGTTAETPEVFSVSTGGGEFTLGGEQTVVGATDVYAGDVDGDGDIDLISASSSDDKIAWFENDGSQSFTEQGVSHSVTSPQSVHAADVNGDGNLDLISASSGDDRIAWFENDGSSTPTLTRRTVSDTASAAQDVYAADVNGDGLLDLIAAFTGGNTVAWYENDGSFVFTEHGVSHAVSSPQSVYAGDVDGDGDIDLMSASSGDDRIAWYENDGSSTPIRRTLSTNAVDAQDVYAADVDGDGDLDIISASSGDDKIAWYENNGGTTGDHFDDEQIVSTNALGAQSVKAHDIDGDGDLDLMSASADDNTIAWYENDGNADPAFTEHEVSTDATTAQSVNAHDINGDGNLDMLSASSGNDKIAWYENGLSGDTFYVDGSGGNDSNDGLSWSAAFATLNQALSVATGNDQIWIAEGTYYPDEGTGVTNDDRGDSFTITGGQDGLKIYGGFASGDANVSDRNSSDHPVILSGDIDASGDASNNSFHVLVFDGTTGGTITNATLLDGVTVTGGNADDTSPDNRAGGLYCIGNGSGNECSPQITNVVFSNNDAVGGAAIYNYGDGGNSSPQITGSAFVNNSASSGGAILNNGNNDGVSSPVITNATFTGNSATGDGGAIFNSAAGSGTSSPQVTNTILWGNSAGGSGNEVFNNNGTPTINHSLVEGGHEGTGNLDEDPIFADETDPDGADDTFATGDDGLRLFDISSAVDAGDNGAVPNGVTTDITGDNRIQNGTVNMGAYESTEPNTSPTVANPITDVNTFENASFTINLADVFTDAEEADSALTFSVASNTDTELASTAIDNTTDELTVDLAADQTGTATITVEATDAGGLTANDDFDVSSFAVGPTIYVDHNATGADDGSSWADAFTSLHDALTAASGSDEIWIAEGVYYPDVGSGVSDNDESASFTITGDQDGLKIYGGFASGDAFADRSPSDHLVILSGDIDDNDAKTGGVTQTASGISGANSDHVLLFDAGNQTGTDVTANITSATLLDGVIVTGGQADGDLDDGGGLYCDGRGSGNECSPTLTNVIFSGNFVDRGGEGGAIYNNGTNSGNSSPTITNAVFAGNEAHVNGNGGAIFNNGEGTGNSSPTITNATFANNITGPSGEGGAIRNDGFEGTSSPTITNAIFWGNKGSQKFAQINNRSANPTISNSLIQDGQDGIHDDANSTTTYEASNIEADPQFLNPRSSAGADGILGTADDGLRLLTGSPALDAGTSDTTGLGLPDTDITGADRIQNSTIDMGAYEGSTTDPAQTIYVDASAGGADDGTSWTDAFTSLQDALTAATDNDEIWIAEGVYFPDMGSGVTDNDATVSFTVTGDQNGLKVYGGFAPGDAFADRSPADHPVILSGDIDDNDTKTNGVTLAASDISGTNSEHVFIFDGGYEEGYGTNVAANITSATVLDGVTITGGFAGGGGFADDEGGGLYCDGDNDGNACSPALTNVTFSGNFADFNGGAIHNDGSSGGESSPTITNGTFSSNNSDQEGGAIYSTGFNEGTSSPTITNTTFTDNFADLGGGAIHNEGSSGGESSLTITNTTFAGNSANSSGGAIDFAGSGLTITNTVFTGNSASGSFSNGGAITGDNLTITNTTFTNNSANDDGGAIDADGGNSSLTNVVLWGNTADADGDGGGTGNEIYNNDIDGATLTLSHTVIEGGLAGIGEDPGSTTTDDGGNISADPLFDDSGDPNGVDNTFATADDGLRLRDGSPALEAGTSDTTGLGLPDTDITGADRIQNNTIDMGAYEGAIVDPAQTIYVDASAGGADDGSSWADAYTSLQEAVTVATRNDEIWIAEGSYIPGANQDDSFTITGAQDGLKIYGGFENGDAFSDRSPADHPVVLSGDIDDDDTKTSGVTLTAADISGDNSYHVLIFDGTSGGTVTDTTVLDGVIVTGGQANAESFPDNVGGGMICNGLGSGNTCSPAITNAIFAGNNAKDKGGAIYNDGRSGGNNNPTITNAVFTGNSADLEGGAIFNDGEEGESSPTILNAVFADNTADEWDGGAIYNNGEDNGTSSPTITNATFTGNDAGDDGGAIFSTGSNGGTSSPTITNSIFYDNSDEIDNDFDTATPTISYSLVEHSNGSGTEWDTELGTDGGNNIDADPLFNNPLNFSGTDGTFATADDGLALLAGSPALEAGTPDTTGLGLPDTDITGADRIKSTNVDMGAYEGAIVDPAQTIYVDASASGNDDGSSWTDAFTSLQDALSASTRNDEIWIAEGSYFPDIGNGITDNDETASFTVTGHQDGLKIYGGFASGDDFADRNPADHTVILSGDIDGDDIKTDGVTLTASDIRGTNSDHVLVFNGGDEFGEDVAPNIISSTVLDGVTVTGGQALDSPHDGGGLYCDGGGFENECSPTLTNIIFTGNNADDDGGAIFNDGHDEGISSPTITNATFSGNNSGRFGGAIFNDGDDGESNPTITNATFINNSTSGDGGAIFNDGDDGESSPVITNATFASNSAGNNGGAIFNGVSTGGTSAPQVTNTILWGNSASNAGPEIYNDGATPTLSYTLIEGGLDGISENNSSSTTDDEGNKSSDPLFIDTGDPDGADGTFGTDDDGLTLQAGSPAIDAGTPDTTGLGLPSEGLAGRSRIINIIDMGAYENPLQVTITGSEGWRMMTAPDDGLSYAELLGDLWLQGMSGGDTEDGTANLYTWNEVSQEFEAISDASTVPDAGTGFIVYVYDDQDFDGTSDGFPKSLNVDETRNSGTVSPELTYNNAGTEDDGFNLVGNPYSSTIDWDASSGWTKDNLQAPIYIWNAEAGEYQSSNGEGGVSTLPNDGLIAPWQGFWVQANATDPVLTFTEDVKSTGGEFLKESEQQPVPQIELELEGTELSSKAVVMFSQQASAGKDSLDAWKLQPLSEQYLSLYTTSAERHALDINALPKDIESSLELNLNFRGSNLGGEYTLSWDPKALPDSWKKGAVTLTDLHTDRILKLNKAGEYSFKVAKNKSSKDSKSLENSGSKSLSKESTRKPDGSKRGHFEQRERLNGEKAKATKSSKGSEPTGTRLITSPRHGPIPTVLKAKTTNPRFVLAINPDASGRGLGEIPEETELAQNYPNPFNPETVIRYGVPEQADVQLNIYDVLGRKVRTLINEQKAAGRYEVNFDGSRLASGLYFYRLKVASNVITKKMMLIK